MSYKIMNVLLKHKTSKHTAILTLTRYLKKFKHLFFSYLAFSFTEQDETLSNLYTLVLSFKKLFQLKFTTVSY